VSTKATVTLSTAQTFTLDMNGAGKVEITPAS
jgi:hypothetical protein